MVCEAPGEAFSALAEEGAARGVTREIPPAAELGIPGHYLVGVLVHDVDADGDLDLAFNQPNTSLDLYLNDGGRFAYEPAFPLPTEEPEFLPLARSFADLDGDGLPEFLEASFSGLTVRPGLEGVRWGEREWAFDARGTRWEGAAWATFSLGDLDGDGALDAVLASLHGPFDPFGGAPPPPEEELVLFGDGAGGFSAPVPLVGEQGPGMSQLVLLSDHDRDGDLDVFVGSDLTGPDWPDGTLFENRGRDEVGLRLVDVGAERGARLDISHMGADSSDLNGDGLLDYCFTIIGPVVCIESDPSGVYVDTSAGLGLVPESVADARYWTGWSMELADLDNDGLEDLVVAGGRSDDFVEDEDAVERPWEVDQPDAIWRATAPGVFEERTGGLGFGSTRESYGLAAADLDGDGALEVVVGHETGRPSVWWNTCSAGGWLGLDLVGPAGNRDAYGALVTVEAAGRRWIQEIYSLRTVGQGPPQLHFGLGDVETIDRITVRWPDGHLDEAEGLGVRRRTTLRHPEAD